MMPPIPTSTNRSAGINHLFSLACLTVAVVGCSPGGEDIASQHASEVAIPVVGGSQLQGYVQASEMPVLVEFGVDFNCPRCAQTKSDIVRLRDSLQGEVDVVRVDFNANVQLVSQLGGTICPTYVLFDQGEPVLTRSFPLSIDLLEGEILRRSESIVN